MESPQRKQNRLCNYDYSLNGAYFVTICTQDRKKILSQIVGDGSPVPKPYGTTAEEMIHPMPDHFHILPRIHRDFGTGNPSPTLGTIIGWYKYQVTKHINAQSCAQGEKIFQRSYYDHVIRNQRDYDEIWQYIENNPRKWVMENRI